MTYKKILALTASCVGLVGTAVSGTSVASAQDAAGNEVPAAEERGGLDVIVVTAQRREENLQDVPISVAVVTGDALANSGIASTDELAAMVPAVQFTRSGPSGLFFVRGVGTTNAAAGEEGANAFYVDGVYLPDLFQAIHTFNNIERIEVLKGPQGTLFGRNATGGLVHVITRDPGDTLTVKGQVGYANYQTVSGQLYVGGPLSDTVSADIALTASDQGEGWGDNLTRGEDTRKGDYWGARSKLVFKPTDKAKITLAGDYFESDDNKALAWRLADENLGLNIMPGAPAPVTPGGQDTRSDSPASTEITTWGASLTGEFQFDIGTLTSITSYRDNENISAFDTDGFESPLVTIAYVSTSSAFQQELRLASNGEGPFGWQVGAFYLDSEATSDQQQRGLAFAFNSLLGTDVVADMTTDSFALFGETSYDLTSKTEIIGGVRYTSDEREFDGTQGAILLDGTPLPAAGQMADLSYEELTWRAALRHDVNDDLNVYASINRGFKAGSFSLQNPTAPPVDPQFITAYEVGLKSEIFDNRVRLNLAAYHYDISDYQVRSAAAANPGSQILLNAADVTVDGFDLEFDAAATENLRLFGGFTLLDSTFEKFENAPVVYPLPAICDAPGTRTPGQVVGAPIGGLLTACVGDVSGGPTPLSPDFSGTLGAMYTAQLANMAELRLSGLFNYNSGYNFEFDGFLQQDSFSTLNLSAEYKPNANWGIEVWGRNVTDEDYFVQKLATGTGALSSQAAPATFGVNLKFER